MEGTKKRYWLFGGDAYYPNGGMNDFVGSFDEIEQAEECVKSEEYEFDWHHIFDTQTGEKTESL